MNPKVKLNKIFSGLLTLKEVFVFLWKKKIWWLLPVVFVLLLVAILLIILEKGSVYPFIYVLF